MTAAVRGEQQLYLMVTMNGNHFEDPVPFTWREGALWAGPAALATLGYKRAEGLAAPVRLDSLQGTEVEYDSANQSVAIIAPLSELDLARTIVHTGERDAPFATSGKGFLLNYDVYATQGSSRLSSLSAATEWRAFHPWGVFANTMLTQVGRSSYVDGHDRERWSSENVRLDSSWVSSWPDQAVSLSVGDTFTSFLGWTRPTRMGGIRLSRDFALQPYRITAPLPAFMGSAALPSSVDLYIDGLRRYRGELPAGPFQLDGLPSITGHGNAQVVLTDALGRRTEIEIPFYASSTLLQQGLTDWSIEAGRIRKDYGHKSFSYAHEPMVSGTARHGLPR